MKSKVHHKNILQKTWFCSSSFTKTSCFTKYMFSGPTVFTTSVSAGHCNFTRSFSVFFTVLYENTDTKRTSLHKQMSSRREGKASFRFYQLEILLKCPTTGYIQQTAQLLVPVCESSCLNHDLNLSQHWDSSTPFPLQQSINMYFFYLYHLCVYSTFKELIQLFS